MLKTSIIIFTAIVLICVGSPSNAEAANWIFIMNDTSKNAGDQSIYIDKESLIYDKEKKILRFWQKIEFVKPLPETDTNAPGATYRLRYMDADLSSDWVCTTHQFIYRDEKDRDLYVRKIPDAQPVGCFPGMPLHPFIEKVYSIAKTGT